MDVLAHSQYLIGFASPDELKSWSPNVRAALVDRLVNSPPSGPVWGALVELLFHCPVDESIESIVTKVTPSLRRWDWRVRGLRHNDPILTRDGGAAMALVGKLVIWDVEDLHGITIRTLCDHPHLDGLRGLQLHKVETFAEHIGTLSRCASLSELESLELSKIRLAGGGVAKVFGESRLMKLKNVRLSSADLDSADLEELVKNPPSGVIERLNLSGNFINTSDLGILMSAVTFPRLEVLDVSDTFVHSKGLKDMVANRNLPVLKKIILNSTAAAEIFGNEMLLKQ